jgi:hypothetical protein
MSTEATFMVEWQEAPGVRAAELAATWARLEIWIDEECVTRVEDPISGASRRGIYCSLYPIAEWVAFNWWFLQADSRVPALSAGGQAPGPDPGLTSWRQRHNLRGVADGFRWPDLDFSPEGSFVRAHWRSDRGRGAPGSIRYLSSGDAYLETSRLTSSLAGLVDSVLARLDEQGVAAGVLGEEWDSIGSLTTDEREFCLAAGRLAVDPYTADEDVSAAILAAEEKLRATLLEEFLDAVDPNEIRSGLGWVERGSAKIRTRRSSNGATRDLDALASADRDDKARQGEPPWAGGYRMARSVRERCGERARKPFKVEGLVPTAHMSADDRALVAIGGRSEEGTQGLLLGHKLPKSNVRFAQARALWHLLSGSEGEHFLVTNSNSGRQKAARAFAAELLAPAQGIAELLEGSTYVDQSTAERVGAHFGVSPLVVQHQIDNQLATGSYRPGD